MIRITLCLSLLFFLSSCALAIFGGGAALGVTSTREGGLSRTGSDVKIGTIIRDSWLNYDVQMNAKLNLTVNNGQVVITGILQDPKDRLEAVRLAWKVNGVTKVINEIKIENSEGIIGFAQDTWITTQLRTAFIIDGEVKAVNYSIDTIQSTVYLMGYARDETELDHAKEITRGVRGVKNVVSYVKIRGRSLSNDEIGGEEAAQPPPSIPDVAESPL